MFHPPPKPLTKRGNFGLFGGFCMKLSVVFFAVVLEDNEPTFSLSLSFSCAECVFSVPPPSPFSLHQKALLMVFLSPLSSLSTLQRSFSSAFVQKRSRDQSGVSAVLSPTMASCYESAHWWEGSALNFFSKLNSALETEKYFFEWTQRQIGASLIFMGKSHGPRYIFRMHSPLFPSCNFFRQIVVVSLIPSRPQNESSTRGGGGGKGCTVRIETANSFSKWKATFLLLFWWEINVFSLSFFLGKALSVYVTNCCSPFYLRR